MYKILIEKKVKSELDRISRKDLLKIFEHISALKIEPRPLGTRKLRDSENLWRIRIGDYRVVYEINDKGKIIIILRIKHRKDVYKH